MKRLLALFDKFLRKLFYDFVDFLYTLSVIEKFVRFWWKIVKNEKEH